MRRAIIYTLLLLITCIVIFSPAFNAPGREKEYEWAEKKSDHFIIRYNPSLDKNYIRDFVSRCEHYYKAITERLGLNRFDFWLWEDRAKIYIYKDKDEYSAYTGRPEWSRASVHVGTKEINTFSHNDDFFETILPHELAHIILREIIGMKTKAPLWFDEGVACANEKDNCLRYLLFTKGLLKKGVYMPLPDLETATTKKVTLPTVFYATSASIIIFLIEKYGREDFVEFCRELGEGGKRFYAVMEEVYDIKDPEGLDEVFLVFMKELTYEDILYKRKFNVEW